MEEMIISSALEEKLENAESLEEVVRLCAEEGIAVTKEELEAALDSEDEGELNAEQLDNVSGGIRLSRIRRIIRRSRIRLRRSRRIRFR